MTDEDRSSKQAAEQSFTKALTAATRLGPQAQHMMRAVFDAHAAQDLPILSAQQRQDIAFFRGQLPEALYQTVDHDRFWGTGWGELRDKGDITRRWMRRSATLAIAAQLQVGSELVLRGPRRAPGIRANHIRLFLDDQPLQLRTRFKLNGAWEVAATVDQMPHQDRPMNMLYITSEKSTFRKEQGERVVLALHALEVKKRL